MDVTMKNSANKAIWSQSLSDLLRRSAKRNPEKTAIICGDVSWTYAEFDHACNRIANSFVSEGVGFGDRVAILSKNSHAFIAVRYALAQIGEIVHRSPQLLSAYYKDEERTKSAFQCGWFHSGDLAIIDDEGFITVVDRKKDMIKTGGEVEEGLYGLDADAVTAYSKEHLAGFKIPKRIVFTDSLPKKFGGKILKRDLRERYAD
ncbi:MAG: acyl-CoA synthetase (AMP-forming)/AMP-acid ligase II [Neolewinella sp.]|jgi:acyl-CoA synthetase (AMP-forming)/AMP-acid ligase II